MPQKDQTLLLGTAREKITPREGVPLVGYPKPRPNTGIAKELYARASVFAPPGSNSPAAVLVVLDTIGVSAELVARMRAGISEDFDGLSENAIMIAATHTHSGPRLYSWYKDGQPMEADAETVELTIAGVRKAAKAAAGQMREVSGRIGLTEAWWGSNRRVVDPEGQATNVWKDLEGLHPGYFNANLRFICFDDVPTAKTGVIFEHYGCHPVVGGQESTRVSSDYPGYLVDRLEAETGARMAVHITGAAANINPRDPVQPDVTRARIMGEALADEVLESIQLTRPVNLQPIVTVREPFEVVLGPEATGRLEHRSTETPEGLQITSEVQILRLGEIAFIGTPGELFAEIGTSIENMSPFRHTIVLSNTNDSLGYMVTESAYREGGYEKRLAPAPDIEPVLLAAAHRALTKAAAG